MAPTMWADAVTRLGRRCSPAGDPPTDAELLRRFARDRDEEAFRALVHRHGPLVWGVAARHAADRHAAEDVFQATFLALARLADRLSGDRSLAAWLHTVAVRTARRTRRQPVPTSDPPEPAARTADPLDALSAREMLAALDDEIGRLPARLRQPILLCCLEGLSRDEAAARLGWTAGSLKGRLERGRELLRKRLAARGVGLAALAVSPVAVSGSLSAATAEAAARYAAGPVGGAAAALAGEVVRAAAVRRWGAVAVAVGLVAAAVGGVGVTLRAAPAPAADPPKPAAAKPAEANPDGPLVRVLADDKPAAGAKVWTFSEYYDPEGKPPPEPPPVVTGADGSARLPTQVRDAKFPVLVFARDPAGRIGCSRYNTYQPPGPEFTVHLVETTRLTGRVVDPAGNPIAGTEVSTEAFALPAGGKDEDNPRAKVVLPPWDGGRSAVRTDADGRFALPGVPAGHLATFKVRAAGRGVTRGVARVGDPVDLTLPAAGAIRIRFAGDGTAADAKGMAWHAAADLGRPSGAKYNRDIGWYEPSPAGPPALHAFAHGKADGSDGFVIPDLPPGAYTLTLTGGGPVAVLPKGPDKVAVKAGETAARCPTAGRARGKWRGRPTPTAGSP